MFVCHKSGHFDENSWLINSTHVQWLINNYVLMNVCLLRRNTPSSCINLPFSHSDLISCIFRSSSASSTNNMGRSHSLKRAGRNKDNAQQLQQQSDQRSLQRTGKTKLVAPLNNYAIFPNMEIIQFIQLWKFIVNHIQSVNSLWEDG